MANQYEVYEEDGQWVFRHGSDTRRYDTEEQAKDFADYQQHMDEKNKRLNRKEYDEFDHGPLQISEEKLAHAKAKYPSYGRLHRDLEEIVDRLRKIVRQAP